MAIRHIFVAMRLIFVAIYHIFVAMIDLDIKRYGKMRQHAGSPVQNARLCFVLQLQGLILDNREKNMRMALWGVLPKIISV